MHVHASALDFLIWCAYALIFGFLLKIVQTWRPDSPLVKSLAVLTD